MLALALPRIATTSRRAGAMMERNFMTWRRHWLVFVSGFFEPVFYLFSLGIGLGALIGDIALPDGRMVDYATFVAPAMLAASAMSGAVHESTFNLFGKIKYLKVYDAVLATPMTPLAIAVGEIGWALTRGTVYAGAFLAVMAGMGLTPSLWAIVALPATVLIGFTFAAVGMACTTYLRSWQDFDYVGVAMFTLFLFSGTFAPLDAYPTALAAVMLLTPLYHGVELTRALTTGAITPMLIVHIGYLLALSAIGLTIASRRMGRLLLK